MSELDSLSRETAMKELTESSHLGERQSRAKVHAANLKQLLDSKPVRETPQRVFRTRIWGEHMTVVTMVQNINLTPPPGAPDIKLQLFVTRPYHTPNSAGATVATLSLAGQYSLDEVVAFLALDKVCPTCIEWTDETQYSSIVVVGDILKRLH